MKKCFSFPVGLDDIAFVAADDQRIINRLSQYKKNMLKVIIDGITNNEW